MTGGNTVKGALLMSSANVSFCLMACMVKYVSHHAIYTTTLFRFLVGLGIMGLLAMSGRIRLSFVNKPALFLRGLMGGAAIAISFFSIAKLGLVRAGFIIQLYPVFAAIFGWILLRERLSIGTVIAILGACIGVCLLLSDRYDATYGTGIGYDDAIAVFGSVLGGLTVVMVKKLQATDSTPAIFFAQCLVGLWIVLIPASIEIEPMTLHASLLLVAIGVFATIGQLLSTDSYRYLPVATPSALVMMLPLITSVAGIVWFHERLGCAGYCGATIVLLSTTAALYLRPHAKKGRP